MVNLKVRRTYTIVEDKHEDAGHTVDKPARKVAVVTVLQNPYASAGFVKDLSALTAESVELGKKMGEMAVQALGGYEAQGYGKGGLVGLNGEHEHANALLTTAFANPIRDAIGGGDAWISSMQKVVTPGATIDIPMNHKDDVYVRSHYDGMTITLQGTPMPDEIAIIFCLASQGRINARVGGLTHEEVQARQSSAKEKIRA